MEDGSCYVPGRFPGRDGFEFGPRSGDSVLELCAWQRGLQRLRRGWFDVGGNAASHAGASRLAQSTTTKERENRMNPKTVPDLILHNGRITTLDSKHPEATSLAIKDGRIVGVDDAERYERGPNTKVIDLNDRRVVPGLNDSHLHVIRGGLN